MNTQLQLGEQLKDNGVQQVAEHDPLWIKKVLTLIILTSEDTETFTADDIRYRATDEGWSQPKHPNAWGAAFSTAAKMGLIERVGYRPSATPSAHARVVAVWRGKTR